MVTGVGYTLPAPVNVAPGQILTVFVQGVGSALTQRIHADGNTLPTSLAGISATVTQGSERPAGIVEVRPVFTCSAAAISGTGLFPQPVTNCGRLTAVTLQIPFNILTLCAFCSMTPQVFVPTTLSISENGTRSSVIEIVPVTDQIHVLTSCDTFIAATTPPENFTGLPCSPLVTHSDGSLVSFSSPAKPGEEVVAYAVGLGAADPPLVAAQPAPSAARTTTTFFTNFNYTPNALPARPNTTQSPLFTGATAGYAGLYQVNFVIPPPPTGTPLCIAIDVNKLPAGSNVVQSNLTVSIGGAISFDGAGICVAVPQ